VAACSVHEELQRVQRAARRGHGAGLRRLLGAHDDVALLERGLERLELILGELVLVREGLELLLLDEAALGGLLDQALGRRKIVQVNRVAQFNPFRSWWGRICGSASSASGGAGNAARESRCLSDL
jgi:hypothetical protein